LKAGDDVDRLTAHIDYFPTFAALVGTKLPADTKLDGRSLLPLLGDPQADWPDRYVFVHQGRWPRGEADGAKFTNCAVRNERFRFVNNDELYDLTVDPGETTNVIDQHSEVVGAMRAAYDAWWQEARAGMVNEDAVGPDVNPFKAAYWAQFNLTPDPKLLEQMKWSNAAKLNERPPRRKQR
jgi:arylsulfatase